MAIANISVAQMAKLVEESNAELIDVRTPAEFGGAHATRARNVPLENLDPKRVFESRSGNPQDPLYVICQGGVRSMKACEKLVAAGHHNIVNVEGGTNAWVAAGLPIVEGKKVMSLERQTRIAAGALVCLGVLLGYIVNPYFIGLSAFVGAGLVFAGLTDT